MQTQYIYFPHKQRNAIKNKINNSKNINRKKEKICSNFLIMSPPLMSIDNKINKIANLIIEVYYHLYL